MRLLFVDDEPQVLKLIQMMLRPMSRAWEVEFAESGVAALALMEQRPFDVVVSDMRMPGMNGAQLLNEVMRRHPGTVRIILSAYSDHDLIMKCVGATHQYLTKPFELGLMEATLRRISVLNQQLANESLRALVAQLGSLPSIPAVYLRMIEALQSPDTPIQAIGETIATDPALTAKLLQLVNSAFFGFAVEVADVNEAVQLLGVGVIRSLVLGLHLFSAFDQSRCPGWSAELLWQHSLRTGVCSRRIAECENRDDSFAELAFTAGLLHDVGKLILAACLPEAYASVLAEARAAGRPLVAAERQRFQASHAEVGGYLLGLWSLPVPLVEAVTLHHNPSTALEAGFSPLTTVHVADAWDNDHGDVPGAPAPLDASYLQALRLVDRVPRWRRCCDEK